MEILEKMKLDNSKPVHKDFYRVASHFLISGTLEPIALEGPQDANKEAIIESLSELIGQNPIEYNFRKMTINETYYGLGMMKTLEKTAVNGGFVVIKNVEGYEESELTAFINKHYCTRKNDRHPDFRMLILRDEIEDNCYSPLYTRCTVIKVSKDPLLEESINIKSNPVKVKAVK